MAETYNVFISWSGERSKAAARALQGWFRSVLQAARPWMSDTDIDKGSRGLEEVGRALEGMKVGVICLTPENLAEPWILFEAGALSKTLDAKTRVCTYLLGGLRPENVTPPLSVFQWTRAEREDTRKLLHAVNKALEGSPVPESNLDALFEGMWPQLEKQLGALPEVSGGAARERSEREMIAEVLELVRAGAGGSKAMEEVRGELRALKWLVRRTARGQVPVSGFAGLGARGSLKDMLSRVGPPIAMTEGEREATERQLAELRAEVDRLVEEVGREGMGKTEKDDKKG